MANETMAYLETKKAYNRTWWALALRGFVALGLGLFTLARPLDSVVVFVLVIAIWALVGGLVEIVRAFDLRPELTHWWVLLLGGFVSAGFGVAALTYYPRLSLTFAVVWASWWFLLTGIFGIVASMQQLRLGLPWGWTMTWALLTLATSGVAFLHPPATLAAIMGLIAGFAVVSGLALIAGALKLKARAHDVPVVIRAASPA
jgi:uncharacterized membrane protein HdeD (DUF308 family)